MKLVERWAGLLRSAACAAALATAIASCSAQTQQTHKKVAPKPELTSAELFAFIRGSLMQYSPDDSVNDNLEVSIDPTATVLTVKQPDGHCDIFLSALDSNTITWDVYDASDSMQTRAPLARLTVIAAAGKNARTCYDTGNNIDPSAPGTRARLLFSWDRIPEGSGFQSKFTKALKNLIKLSGGTVERDIFKN
jgi:hypothetical protein